jgi:hypothetical protein
LTEPNRARRNREPNRFCRSSALRTRRRAPQHSRAAPRRRAAAPNRKAKAMGKQPGCDPTAMKNLRELKALYDEGVLSESEYASEKSKHMDKLWPRPPLPDAPAPKRKRGPRKKAPKKDATEAEAPPPPAAEAPGGTTSVAFDSAKALGRAGQESEIPNFKGSYLGRFPLVLADVWTSDHLLERSRSVDVFSGTRARGTLTLKRH